MSLLTFKSLKRPNATPWSINWITYENLVKSLPELFLMAKMRSLGEARWWAFWCICPSGPGEPRAPPGKGHAPGEGRPSGPRPGLRLRTREGGLRRCKEEKEKTLIVEIFSFVS